MDTEDDRKKEFKGNAQRLQSTRMVVIIFSLGLSNSSEVWESTEALSYSP